MSTSNNSIALKCLAWLLVGLLLAAITGGVLLGQQVAGMSASIDALTLTVQELNGRMLYLERAVRLANRDGDARR